jgi:hypothetical protein
MKPNKLSHTALNKYMTCGKSYDFHYNQRLREKTRSGALIFGSALDAPLDALHNGTANNLYEIFDNAFTEASVATRDKEFIPTNESIVYAAKDFDKDLLLQEDIEELEIFLKELGFEGHPNSLVKFIADEKKEKGWKNLSSKQRQYYNFANWLSLRRKGHIMIDGYVKEVLPNVVEVLAVQKHVLVKNDEGDELVAYLDMVVKWKMPDGTVKVVTLDRKTSSMEYEADSVRYSNQLSLYIGLIQEEYKSRTAGFIVLYKDILKNRKKVCSSCKHQAESGSRHKTCNNEIGGKRCGAEWNETIDPKCRIDVIIDDIPEIAEAIVMDNFDSANALIKQGVFTRNFNSCQMPWGACPYINVCWKNDYSDVVKLPESKK